VDPRYKKISDLLIDYSMGHFENRIELSEKLDETDAFISGINMLGEELKTTTISRNYFNNIFNSVSDMIFVLTDGGMIENVNRTALEKLDKKYSDLIGLPIDQLLVEGEKPLFEFIKKKLGNSNQGVEAEKKFKTSPTDYIPASCSVNFLHREVKGELRYLVTVRDLSKQKEMENLVIRTIVDTLENERIRVAKDLHDSLGQQLSAVKFYLETLINITEDKKISPILTKSGDALKAAQAELREICFDLMPMTLETYGLVESVHELCRKIGHKNLLEFIILPDKHFPLLNKQLEIAIFRIVQEFINNSIKHGRATRITLKFNFGRDKDEVKIELKDDGKGFDKNKLYSGSGTGMGLQNVRSRIRSYDGTIKINSLPGKGTEYGILIPLNKTTLQR